MQDRWADYIDTPPRTERFWTGLVIGFVWGALAVTIAAVWWTHDRAIIREAARAKVEQRATDPLYLPPPSEDGTVPFVAVPVGQPAPGVCVGDRMYPVRAPRPRFNGVRPHVVTYHDVADSTLASSSTADRLNGYVTGTSAAIALKYGVLQDFMAQRVPSTALVQP